MQDNREKPSWKIFAGILALVSLIASMYLSIKSFTGYVISEQNDMGLNLAAMLFFVAGISSAYLFAKK